MPAVCRWAVRVDNWHPEQEEWNFLLRLLSSEVEAEVQRYKFEADRRRCLVSKLLQRKCVRDVCSVPFSEINIRRTKGGKPFCANHCHPVAAPNFNFNVSHEGGYVVLAAEPICICGIDVAAPSEARSAKTQTPADLFRAFDKQFTAEEWTCIKAAGSEAEQMQEFQRHWSLKEAFVKARGDGLGFDLGRVQFQLSAPLPSGSQSATAKVDGNLLLRWRFAIQMLGEQHVVSVALGPPEDVVDAWGVFKGTFQKTNLSLAEMQDAFEAPRPLFTTLTISDVIPAEAREAYAAAGGDTV
ncbi:TPA: hypothetical protein ACH3X1_010702 [Trebouxia sp. C0004]